MKETISIIQFLQTELCILVSRKKKIQFYYNAFVQTMYMFYTFRQHCNNFEKIKKLLENIFSVPVDRSSKNVKFQKVL